MSFAIEPEKPSGDPWRGYLAIGVVIVVCLAVAFGVGRCSGPNPIEILPEPGIDAGPGEAEIAERFDASVETERARLEELERAHQAEVAAFSEAEREAFEERRGAGRSALASWFKERSRSLLLDGGTR